MRTTTKPSVAHLAILAALIVVPAANAQGLKCDRACLASMMTRYLDAMMKHDPSSLPVAPNVKFTEDGKALKLGEGAWKTVS